MFVNSYPPLELLQQADKHPVANLCSYKFEFISNCKSLTLGIVVLSVSFVKKLIKWKKRSDSNDWLTIKIDRALSEVSIQFEIVNSNRWSSF